MTRPLCFGIVLLLAQAPTLSAQEAPFWSTHVIDRSSDGADGARIFDANGDGLVDVVTGWEEGGLVRLYLHPGRNAVRSPWPAVTVGAVDDVEDAASIGRDRYGRLSLVSAAEGGTRRLTVHTLARGDTPLDSASWSTAVVPASADRMQWMFTYPDESGRLFAGGKNEGAEIGFFESTREEPHNWTWRRLGPVGWLMSLEAVDMDGDGDLDVLLSDRRGPFRGVRWYENPGRDSADSWSHHFVGARDHEVMFIDYADIDQDGGFDIVAATSGGPVLLFRRLNQYGTSWSRHEIPVPTQSGTGKGIAAGDLDDDGRIELAFSCEHARDRAGILVFTHSGDPWGAPWSARDIGGPMGTKFDLIELIDLDGDGDLDLLTCEEAENLGVIWYENPRY